MALLTNLYLEGLNMKIKLLALTIGLVPLVAFAQPGGMREEGNSAAPYRSTDPNQQMMQPAPVQNSMSPQNQTAGSSSSAKSTLKFDPRCQMVPSSDGLYSVPNQYCNF